MKLQVISRRSLMAMVPSAGNPGDGNNQNYPDYNAYFLQLLQENQQINVFVNDWSMEHSTEEQAEARHRQYMNLIYTEAELHIRSLEAHADAEHTRRLGFIHQSTSVLINQMNTEMTVFRSEAEQLRSSLLRSELISHEEKQAAQQLTSRNAALSTQTLHYQTALRHNELQTAQLRTSFDENRTTLLEYLAERFEEKMQWEENESNYRLSVEEQQHDELVTDLMDQNAELQAEVQSLRLEFAEHRASPPQGGAPIGPGVGEIPLEKGDDLSPPQGGANHNAVAFQGPQGSNASWMPTLPDPRVVPKELEGILGRPQVFSMSGGPKDNESEAQEVQKDSDEPTEQKPSEAPKVPSPHDSLVSALKAAIGKKDDDDKPRVKEAETIRLPGFPNPESYRSWKISVREAVRAASDRPDEAFNWVQEVYEKSATIESLRHTGKFITLDTKILNALSVVAKGELNRQIINYKESEAAASRAVRGRQVLFMFEQFFKTNEAAGSLYSVEDLLKVKLVRDDLSTFIHNWESVIAGLNHQPEETTLRDILLRELRNSSKLKFDLEVYDRAKEGEENHTYGYLVKCVKELLERERTRSNRTAIAKAHGARYGTPAYDEKPKTPTTPRGRDEKKPCFAFQRGKCPRGKNCPFEHVKADPSRGRTPPRSPKGGRPGSAGSGKGSGKDKDKSKIPCIFYPKGTCKNGKNCPFLHKDASPSVPAKGDGKQRANSPAKRRRPSKKRGKSADKKATCCLSANATLTGEPYDHAEGVKFALAARKGEAGPRDHWVIDEDKGVCVRVHQKFRTSLYVPQPDHCPVPFWRLKGNAQASMYPKEESTFSVEKEYNFKSGDLQKPVERWIGTTTFRLKPKCMKAKFASKHETIDIALEGDGWSFVKPKRLHMFRYAKSEDCPKSDPNDLNDALESAIYLESAVTGMRQGIDVRCKYKCHTRDGFCIHCKSAAPIPMIATPARVNGSNLEIIADTGSEEDLISHSDLDVHFRERAKQIPSNAVSLITANGPVEADTKHEVHVEALDQPLQFVLLPNTPAVCSVGKKCMEQGFSFVWPKGEAPHFICPDGRKVQCQMRGNVPVFGDRGPLSACPATTSESSDRSRIAPTSVKIESGFR